MAAIGAAALAAYIVYKVGEATIFDFGDGKDKGIDLLPWPGDGLDLDPGNKMQIINDDAVPGMSKREGLDLLPSWIDGDGFDVLPWEGGFITDDVRAPETPPVAIADPPIDVQPPPPAPPVWQPRVLNFEPGSGLISEIHEQGHAQIGYENFTDVEATNVFQTVRARFGNNLITPIDVGVDEYLHGNDLWVARAGRAQWASEQIERAIREEIAKAA